MRKSLLGAALLLGAVASQAAITTDFEWFKTLEIDNASGKTSSLYDVCQAPDGDYYVAGGFSATESATWGGENVAPEGGFTFDSQKGLFLARIKSTGELVWKVVPSLSNVEQNYVFITPTPDGGVALAVNATSNKNGAGYPTLRRWSDGDVEVVIDGPEMEVPANKAPYVALVLKFNDHGMLAQSYQAAASYTNAAGAFEVKPLQLKGICADEIGNLYVGGVLLTSMTVGDKEVKAVNINAPTIDSKGNPTTTSNGDAVIIKLNANCEAVAVAHNPSEGCYASKEAMGGIGYADGKVYCGVLVDPATDIPYSFFGAPVGSFDQKYNFVCGALNASNLEGVEGCCAVTSATSDVADAVNGQLQSVAVTDKLVLLAGSYQGKLIANGADLASSVAKKLENVTIAVDRAAMQVVSAGVSGLNIGVDYAATASADGKTFYAYGYCMTGNQGFLSAYNTADGSLVERNVLFTGTGATNGFCYNAETKQMLCTSYTKGLKFTDDDATPTYGQFQGVLVAFATTGIEAESSVEGLSVAEAEAPVEYFNLQGIRIANPAAGTLVICRQGATATKVVIR